MRKLLAALYSVLVYVFFLAVFLYAIGFVENVLVPKSIDSGSGGQIVISLLIDPYQFDQTSFVGGSGDDVFWARFAVLSCGLIATAAYAAVVWGMYKSMVKNFDMTIRRQQR